MATADVFRHHGGCSATFYKWKSKYGGLAEDQAKRSFIAGNVLDRQFTADRPNQKWVELLTT